MKNVANGLLLLVSIFLACGLAEGATRLIDGLPLFADYLPNTVDRDVTAAHLDDVPRAQGVSRDWFFQSPPPLPNRHAVPPLWIRLAEQIGQAPNWNNTAFRPADQFKAWNSVFARNPCDHPLLRQAPGRLYTYDSLDGTPLPRFRFVPNATTPLGLVTNQLGWRGPPVKFHRAENTIRIVFVGASTTVNSHHYPFSYPELVGHWLNVWAEARGLSVRFEALNAGRESVTSTDIAAIVRNEVVPMRPDLVVYYEGANQFDVKGFLMVPPVAPSIRIQQEPEDGFSRLLREASTKSALARRAHAAIAAMRRTGAEGEWEKPDYELRDPGLLDQANPDITRNDLPFGLPIILADLERIRLALLDVDAELAVSSYKWLAYDGMVVDAMRNRALLDHLNFNLYPLRYRDIARAASFQNRVLAKFAALRDLPFIDVAGQIPSAPDLYTDGVHMSYGGIRLHAWVVFQTLVPLAEKRLATHVWPRPPVRGEQPNGLFFSPTEIFFDCEKR